MDSLNLKTIMKNLKKRIDESIESIVWNYDSKKINLNDPKAKIWFLERKLQFGQLKEIRKNLKKISSLT